MITKTKSSIQKETDSQIVGLSLGYNVGISIIDKETHKMTNTQISNEELIEVIKWVSESSLKNQMAFLIPEFSSLLELNSSKNVIKQQSEKLGDAIDRIEELKELLKNISNNVLKFMDLTTDLTDAVQDMKRIDIATVPNILTQNMKLLMLLKQINSEIEIEE
jgi:ribosomal 50S subunit-associated protein YjgA (DUF615 family)